MSVSRLHRSCDSYVRPIWAFRSGVAKHDIQLAYLVGLELEFDCSVTRIVKRVGFSL